MKKQPVVMSDRVKQVSGTLIIMEAKVEDSGKYLCVVNNSVGGESVETVLTVTAPLSAAVEPTVQTVDFGRPAVFTCNYEGNPVKTISWMKDGKSLPQNGAVLKIDSVRKEDKGMYQCFVRNEQESAQASAELKLGSRFEPPLIKESFKSNTLQPGPDVYLKCVATGNPTPEITWYLDEKKLTNSDRLQVGQYVTVGGAVVSHVNITAVKTNDGGLYKCVASSKVGSVEHSERLNIFGPPYVRTMEKKAIVAGETLFVTCPVAGHPIESIVWERDGRALPINRKQKVFPNGTLIIENVERLSDQATYTCVAKNSQGYSSRGSLEVQVMVPPEIAPMVEEIVAVPGDQVSLSCLASKGDHPMKVVWSFSTFPQVAGSNLPPGAFLIKIDDGIPNIMVISRVAAIHNGFYTCSMFNHAGSHHRTTHVIVNVPPRWIIEPTDKAFAQGSDAKIECKADGFPRPVVTWKRATGDSPGDYKDLKANDQFIRVEEGTLTIRNVQKKNEGYYLCEAVNGIGSGLSAVILLSVQAPPQFENKFRNQTSRLKEPTVLQCQAKGEKPIGIIWNMNNKRLDPKRDVRYTIREDTLPNGVLSDLSIRHVEREDSGLFTCVATNSFGSDDSSINLIVQEVPEAPLAVKVLDKSGRSVQLSWATPYDGNSPITRYVIEYKVSKGTWDQDIEREKVPGEQTLASVFNLRPATTYHMRVVAENEVGTSVPSDVVTIITAEEAPSGPPTAIKVEPVDQVTLKVFWKPPLREEWNGDIQGYYVGYKLSSSDKPYLFETVEFSKEEGKEHHLIIGNLKTYTEYAVVVQAFNKLGPGPMSEQIKQHTAEGIPEEAPKDLACTTLTSQTIRVSWQAPRQESANGQIKGYKVIYGPSESWFDEKTKDSKITPSTETIIHGLQKFTNYSMQVLAFTNGGDGVRSVPIHCQTEQDVPEPPASVKALVMSPESILLSWKPPTEPNGMVLHYTVYVKEEHPDGKFDEPHSQRMPPFQMSYEATGLKSDGKYEFWVTASTNIGEGQPSKTVILTPDTKVPARIASFDSRFTATYREDVKLPCLAVGMPAPDVTWKIKGVVFEAGDRMRQLPEGSLLIKSVTRSDAGEYSCSVENSFGHDSVTHSLVILAPPHVPQVSVQSTTTNSITMKLKPNTLDTEPIHGYTVKYKPEFGDWETLQLGPQVHKYTLENLWCGSRYMISVTAYNSIGMGDESDILNTRTKGSKPVIPEASRFIEVSTSSITLHLSAWSDGGCPMLYFVVEHKKKASQEWNQVSNNVTPGGNFVVLDLDPATWYQLRVTAHNNAGFAVAEYEFATLTVTGGTVSPPKAGSMPDVHQFFPWIPRWLDLNIVVPMVATIIVLLVGVIVICIALGRKRGPQQIRLRDDIVYNQSMVGANTMDKRRPELHDELGYIPPPNRKLPPVPGSNYNTCDRIKRGTAIRRAGLCSGHSTWNPRRHVYEELSSYSPCRRLPRCPGSDETMYHRAGMDEDICPYATFHLLGFREEMDPSKAMQFQTFPHQNGHCGTLGPQPINSTHHRSGSHSMPRANGRYSRVDANSTFSPEYDDPANCTEDDPYGSQYTPYGAPYDHYSSRNSLGRRSIGSARNVTTSSSPEPPPPPPRNQDTSNNSANDSKESNEISEAECDQALKQVSSRANSKDGMTTEEMRKLLDRNEGGQFQNGGLTAYNTMAV